MLMHPCVYSINTHSGLTKCHTLCQREGQMDVCAMSPTSRGLCSGGEGRHREALSTRPEAGPCQGPEKITALNQTLLLPSRSSPSRGRGKYSNKWLWRWRSVCFPNLKDFWFSCILMKNPSGGWKPLIGISVTGRYYLKVPLSVFHVKESHAEDELPKCEEQPCALELRAGIRCVVWWCHGDYGLSKTVQAVPSCMTRG